MEEVDRLILHALEQIGVSCLSSSSSISSLRDFAVADVVEGVSRCVMAIDPSLSLPLKMPPSMAARYRIGTDLANAVRAVGFNRQVGYQTFMYLNENDLRDLFVFLVEALPKEKMDDVGEEGEGGGGSRGAAAAALRRKCVDAVAAALKGGNSKSVRTEAQHRPLKYEDFETIRLKIPRYHEWSKVAENGDQIDTNVIREYQNEILPWVWDQTDKGTVVMASLLEANARSIIAEGRNRGEIPSICDVDYDVGDMLKKAISAAKGSMENEALFSPTSPHKVNSAHPNASEVKPVKPTKPSKLSKPKLDGDKDAADAVVKEVVEEDAAAAVEGESSEKAAAIEREAALKHLEDECESTRLSLGRLKEEILSLHESRVQKDEVIADLARQKLQVESKISEWDKISSLLPDAEENAKKLEMRLANAQQKMVKLQEEWNAVRMPLEEEIRAASAKEDVKSGVVDRLTEDLTNVSGKCLKLKEDVAEKDGSLKAIGKQLEAAFPKGEEEENEKRKAVSRNSFTKRILEIVHNIKKQKTELDRIIADTKELSKTVNSLEGKLDRSFSLADELVFKDAKKDEAVRKAYKLLAALHETCGALIGVVDEIGATLRGKRDKEDEVEREEQLEMESNLEKITKDLESMKKENADMSGRK